MKLLLIPLLIFLVGCLKVDRKKSKLLYEHECWELALEHGYPEATVAWDGDRGTCYGTNRMKAEKITVFHRQPKD